VLEVTTNSPELEAIEVEDIGDDVVEEARVVRDDNGSASGQTSEVVLQPGYVNDVEMVSRFVEQEDVGLEQHGTGKSQLHLPATREASDGMPLALIIETDGGEGRDDLGLVSEDTAVAQNEVKDGSFGLRTVNVVLNVECSDHVRRWETFDLAIE
jgi:hypothetical protein